jgi:hypothetical protein
MRRLCALAIAFFACSGTCDPQGHKVRIFLTGTDQSLGNSSNVSAAEVGKGLDKHCPEVVLTIEQQKADYLLQARDTGAGAARKPYKFTLFDAISDRIFSTETSRLDSAVKDVCTYIRKREIVGSPIPKGATLGPPETDHAMPVPPGAVLCANGPSDPMPWGAILCKGDPLPTGCPSPPGACWWILRAPTGQPNKP